MKLLKQSGVLLVILSIALFGYSFHLFSQHRMHRDIVRESMAKLDYLAKVKAAQPDAEARPNDVEELGEIEYQLFDSRLADLKENQAQLGQALAAAALCLMVGVLAWWLGSRGKTRPILPNHGSRTDTDTPVIAGGQQGLNESQGGGEPLPMVDGMFQYRCPVCSTVDCVDAHPDPSMPTGKDYDYVNVGISKQCVRCKSRLSVTVRVHLDGNGTELLPVSVLVRSWDPW